MKRPLAPLVLLALAGLLLGPPTAHAQKPRAERPTYAVGDKWIRSDGVYDLIRIEKDMYIFAAEGGREIRMTKDLAIAAILTAGAVDFEFDPPLRLTWPLEVGKWGMTRGFWKEPSHPHRGGLFSPVSGTQAMSTWSVEAYEDIHVPAGTFRAFRVVFDTNAPGVPGGGYGSGYGNPVTAWYAPEVRQFVKFQGRANLRALNIEVVAIERPGPAGIQVALEGLPDQTRVSTESLVVAGKVSASTGIARVTVTLNGQDISKQEEKQAAKKELALSVPLQLKEGKNLLLITAVDAGGDTRQEARTVLFEKSRTVSPALPSPVAALPPFVVSLASPTDQARVGQETIGLSGVLSGGKGVSRVLVALNGVEVSRQTEPTPQRTVAVNVPLTLREGQNTLVVTAAEPDGTLHQELRTVHYEKSVPLTVTIRYPADGLQVSQESSVVAGIITSSKGVAKVSVTLNGAEVHQQTERAPPKSVAVVAPIALRDGVNALVVSASEADGTVRQELRTVIYTRPQVAAVPPPAAPPPQPIPDRWAVVIGVGNYESPDVPRLRYTVPDAEAVFDVLTGLGGFKKEHVLLLTDKTEKKPTYRNLKWALGTFLARSAKKDDTVLIYFAGHGAPEVDQRSVERDGLSKYLVPTDADPDDLYSTALPMDELQTIFGRLETERVIVFLDSCYSGAAGGRTFASKKTRASHVDELFLERLASSKGRAIVTASRPAEVSIELAELGHGIFTYYLVQGLQGAADLNKDGIVTLQELYEYVEQQVTRKSRSVGGNQHPVMKGELEGVLPLVKVRGR